MSSKINSKTKTLLGFQNAGNQWQRENLESQKKTKPYVKRNKDKNYNGPLLRNYASNNRKKKNLIYLNC